jgi:ubiquinone biosynthesis protein COQ9
MSEQSNGTDEILDDAMQLAESRGWEELRLHELAASLGISLEEIRKHFREKDELIDGWFDRADNAMLREAASADFLLLRRRERMHRVMMAWLHALSEHRRVTRQMILRKLEPVHIHLQIPALMRISRTVQWMREAAGYDASFPRRAFEEIAHTSIYLLTFTHWMFDDSPHSERTRRFLDGHLRCAEPFLSGRFAPRAHSASDEPMMQSTPAFAETAVRDRCP